MRAVRFRCICLMETVYLGAISLGATSRVCPSPHGCFVALGLVLACLAFRDEAAAVSASWDVHVSCNRPGNAPDRGNTASICHQKPLKKNLNCSWAMALVLEAAAVAGLYKWGCEQLLTREKEAAVLQLQSAFRGLAAKKRLARRLNELALHNLLCHAPWPGEKWSWVQDQYCLKDRSQGSCLLCCQPNLLYTVVGTLSTHTLHAIH
jgi:hypothetical protein